MFFVSKFFSKNYISKSFHFTKKMQPPEAIDQKQLHQTAQELTMEFQQLRDESYRVSRRTPRWWHKYVDGFQDWRHHRRLQKGSQTTKLIARPWVPYVVATSLALIWIPDSYKINFLYWVDSTHEKVKLNIHLWYWKQVMPPEKYALLMEQMEQNMPKSKRVQSPDCPL